VRIARRRLAVRQGRRLGLVIDFLLGIGLGLGDRGVSEGLGRQRRRVVAADEVIARPAAQEALSKVGDILFLLRRGRAGSVSADSGNVDVEVFGPYVIVRERDLVRTEARIEVEKNALHGDRSGAVAVLLGIAALDAFVLAATGAVELQLQLIETLAGQVVAQVKLDDELEGQFHRVDEAVLADLLRVEGYNLSRDLVGDINGGRQCFVPRPRIPGSRRHQRQCKQHIVPHRGPWRARGGGRGQAPPLTPDSVYVEHNLGLSQFRRTTF
jgi:hypothetical protein